MADMLTRDEVDELYEAARQATDGPLQWGIVDPALDPYEWFKNCMEKRADEGFPMNAVTTADQRHESGDYLIVAVTGNGPKSEANAQFFVMAREMVPRLIDERIQMRREIDRLEELVRRQAMLLRDVNGAVAADMEAVR